MMTVRLKFTKGEEVKYISHLDLMRTFQRSIRRARVPIAYSGGFNPHQEISFGAPLSLGVTSDAEYLDMKLAEEITIEEIKTRLNEFLPKGIRINSGAVLPEKTPSAMALVTHARYLIKCWIDDVSMEELQEKVKGFLEQESIKAMKKQPKNNFALKEIDIKPMIINFDVLTYHEGSFILRCLLKSGSKENLKPELLMVAFSSYTGYNIYGIKINREEVYAEKEGRLVDLIGYIS